MGFRDAVIGHEMQKMILQNSIKRARLSSSYLFSGEAGIGKALLARQFVKVLFCGTPVKDMTGPDSCESCSQCKKIEHGNHPDLMVIKPEGQQIKISEVRSAQEFLSIKPIEAHKRVLIVDEAEKMNESAQNAFLKTLEEPPPTALIILITMSPDMLLPTVRSRCFHLKFGLLTRSQTERVLKRLFPEAESERITQLTNLSMGRPGLVISETPLWDPSAAVEALRRGDLVPETRDRERLMSLLPFYELLLRDILLRKVSKDSRLYLFPEISGLSLGKNLTWTDIIELYMKIQWLKEINIFNPNASLMGNYLRSQLGVLYEGN